MPGVPPRRSVEPVGHLSARDGYRRLADRLNRFPQGAPPSERLFRILEILFSPREAELVAQLPIRPFRTATAAQRLGPATRRGGKGSRDARLPRPSPGPRAGWRAALRPPAPHGRLLRVLDDAGPRGRRPEAAGRALLRVPERRGGLHQGPLRARRDPARPHVRAGTGPARRALAAGPRLRAGEPRDPGGVHGRGQPVLLPAQDGARGAGLRRTPRHLPHLRRHRPLAREARLRAEVSASRGPGAPAPGPGAGPRAVRRERAREAGLHLQLLRLLLRGHARGATLRVPAPGPHHELRRGAGRGGLRRLRQVREGLPGRCAAARAGRRPRPPRPQARRGGGGPLPRLRRLHPGVPEGGSAARGAEGARPHPGQLDASRRGDGDRARESCRISSSTTRPTSATARWPRSSA